MTLCILLSRWSILAISQRLGFSSFWKGLWYFPLILGVKKICYAWLDFQASFIQQLGPSTSFNNDKNNSSVNSWHAGLPCGWPGNTFHDTVLNSIVIPILQNRKLSLPHHNQPTHTQNFFSSPGNYFTITSFRNSSISFSLPALVYQVLGSEIYLNVWFFVLGTMFAEISSAWSLASVNPLSVVPLLRLSSSMEASPPKSKQPQHHSPPGDWWSRRATDFSSDTVDKNPPPNAVYMGSIPGPERFHMFPIN